ncbi:GTPase [Candidatus Carsonella ruddii]|uniref:GTPase and tRNA-U34 5-formylation enzyme TrmE n=1 Tax=Carsonella ruddii TaxID=114186 RepID=A0A1U9RRL5_CARRU|nr:GTPase [Candidatus Carsonella ruddii]AQU89419.1 GTPase and tRNA-U34 5-formylation enzyme TrmE [Candidatus Carsonella ruddii]
MNKIIVAQATPEGLSSICIVRASGENVKQFIEPLIKINLKKQKLTYTKLYDLNNKVLDFILVVYFQGPNSLTGEDIIEFHLHGSICLSKKVIKMLLLMGARLAKPGEFLEKRYLNGKISLIECEIINNKIFYNNENIFKLTIDSQKNIFLCIIKNSKFRLNMLIICLETSFINENDTFLNDFIFLKKFLKKFKKLINILLYKINKVKYLTKNFEILIMGKRNVGKSTLFNKMCLNYNSIITNIPGTTKNTISKEIYFSSKNINLNDTAGLKLRTKNFIEKIGILRNINKIFKSDLIIYIVDKFNIKNIFYNMPLNFLKKIKNNLLIIVINKCDIFGISEGFFKIKKVIFIFLNAKNSIIINNLKCFISKMITNKKILDNNLHYTNIHTLYNKCSKFYENFFCSYDLTLENIINFQKKVLKISGDYTNQIILNSIFRNFCMGK